ALVAAGDGDRGVAIVQPFGEVAAGRRRPAELRQLAHVGDDFAGEVAEAVAVVGRRLFHVPSVSAGAPSGAMLFFPGPWSPVPNQKHRARRRSYAGPRRGRAKPR